MSSLLPPSSDDLQHGVGINASEDEEDVGFYNINTKDFKSTETQQHLGVFSSVSSLFLLIVESMEAENTFFFWVSAEPPVGKRVNILEER